MSNAILLTSVTLGLLKKELLHLQEKRETVLLSLKDSRSQGDLSENSAYESDQNTKEQIENRILKINEIITPGNYRILNYDEIERKDIIHIGAKVKMSYSSGKEINIIICGADSVCLPSVYDGCAFVDYESTVGKLIINKSKNCTIHNNGKEFKILDVSYEYLNTFNDNNSDNKRKHS